jgi:hypothetical protein
MTSAVPIALKFSRIVVPSEAEGSEVFLLRKGTTLRDEKQIPRRAKALLGMTILKGIRFRRFRRRLKDSDGF